MTTDPKNRDKKFFYSGFKNHKSPDINPIKHTKIVRTLKLIFPSIAGVLIAMVIIWPQINLEKDRFKINFVSPNFKRTERLKMLNARFFANDKRNQPYSLTADMASETSPGTMIIELFSPKADIMLNDGSWIAAEAKAGFLYQKEEMLELKDGVSLFHDKGYSLDIGSIKIDLKNGSAQSDSPVSASTPFGEMRGDGLTVLDRGEKITVTGKSKFIIYSMPKG